MRLMGLSQYKAGKSIDFLNYSRKRMALSVVRLDKSAVNTSKLDASLNGGALKQQDKLLGIVVKLHCFCIDFHNRFEHCL